MIVLELLKAIFYGILEGVTEWLPISSTGHIILLSQILPIDFSGLYPQELAARFFEMFEVVIQLGASLAEYVEAMRRIILFYEIDFIDLYNNGFPKPTTDLGDEFTIDGLHPNDFGYELIAESVCEYIQNKKLR